LNLKKVFIEIFEIFKDEIFLKKLYSEWLKDLSKSTIQYNNDISRYLKIVYEEQEVLNSVDKKAPKCRFLYK